MRGLRETILRRFLQVMPTHRQSTQGSKPCNGSSAVQREGPIFGAPAEEYSPEYVGGQNASDYSVGTTAFTQSNQNQSL